MYYCVDCSTYLAPIWRPQPAAGAWSEMAVVPCSYFYFCRRSAPPPLKPSTFPLPILSQPRSGASLPPITTSISRNRSHSGQVSRARQWIGRLTRRLKIYWDILVFVAWRQLCISAGVLHLFSKMSSAPFYLSKTCRHCCRDYLCSTLLCWTGKPSVERQITPSYINTNIARCIQPTSYWHA